MLDCVKELNETTRVLLIIILNCAVHGMRSRRKENVNIIVVVVVENAF